MRMSPMFPCACFRVLPEDKKALFRKWMENKKCFEATEAALVLEKERESELKRGWEELTLKQMVEKGFSACLG